MSKIIIGLVVGLLMSGLAYAKIIIADTPDGRVTCVTVGDYVKCS